MRKKFLFFKNIKFQRIIALLILLISVFFIYRISDNNIHKHDKISEIGYRALDDDDKKSEFLENPEAYDFYKFKDLNFNLLQKHTKDNVLIKITTEPIDSNYTYLLTNVDRKYGDYIKAFTSDGIEIKSTNPNIISHNQKSELKYYLLPQSDEPMDIYVYLGEGYALSRFNNPFFLVGTESDLLLAQWSKSIPEFLIAFVLLFTCLFLFFIFYIIVVDNQLVVRLFSLSFLFVAIQALICSPGVAFTFNKYSTLLNILEILVYLIIAIITFIIPIFYTSNENIKKFYKYSIIGLCIIVFTIVINEIIGNYTNVFLLNICNIYFIGVSIYSLLLNLRDFEDETETISILRTLSFFSLVNINIMFFLYETKNLLASSRVPYYFLLCIYAFIVIAYISYVFYYNSNSVIDAKKLLSEEKLLIDRINQSSKLTNNSASIEQILNNVIDDIKMLYPTFNNILILKKDKKKTISIVQEYNIKDTQYNINSFFKKHFKKSKKSTFSTYFNGPRATLSFTSQTNENFLIVINTNKNLSNLDEIVGKILLSSIVTAFDNYTTYDDIYKTEQGFLLSIGNLISQKSGLKSLNNWRIGEYCYILAKKAGMSEVDAKRFKIASYIADIGKLGLPDEYYNFNSILVSERQIFYSHTTIGYEILSKITNKTMQTAAVCALNHHETYNGKGYLGKSGKDIPILARIFSIASMFENSYIEVCNNSKELSTHEKVRETYKLLVMSAQTDLDPELVQEFMNIKKDVEHIVKIS